jgi:DNA-directed RNA polymerase specialized sigma24 family protein
LLKSIDVWEATGDFENFLKGNIKRKRCDIYRKKKRLSDFEVYYTPAESEDGSEVAFEIADEFNIEEYVIQKKKADQLALIDSLLKNADETTTAIVATFLAHPKPTATAIAKELGVHHSKVTRALNRLAGKFSTKQYGDYSDYLLRFKFIEGIRLLGNESYRLRYHYTKLTYECIDRLIDIHSQL